MTSKLLQPIQVGNLTFKNRIMFPNVIKLRDDEPSGYYCLDGIFI